MATNKPPQLENVLDILVNTSFVDIKSLIAISCSSKQSAVTVNASLIRCTGKPLHNLLVAAAREAAQLNVLQQNGWTDQVQLAAKLTKWLLQQAGPEQQVFDTSTGTASFVAQLLHVSNIPTTLAETLVAQGLRFTYQQLLSAARDLVQGVEVWVKAYKQLGVLVPKDMPQVVVGLLSEDIGAAALAQQVSSEHLLEVLTFTLTISRTAYTQNVLCSLVKLPVFHGIPVETVFELIQTATKVRASERVLALVELPAAQGLTRTLLLRLLETALQSKLPTSVRALCGLPAATQLTAADIQRLLHLAVQLQGAGGVKVLCGLPAALNLQVEAVYDILAAAMNDSNKFAAIFHLPAAAQLLAAHVAELLALAVSGSAASCAIALCELPAAQQLMGRHVLGVLQEAIQNRSAATVVALWRIPAARSSNHEAVVELLQTAGESTADEPSATFNPADVVSTLLAGFPAGQPVAAVVWGLAEAAANLGYNAAKRLPEVVAALADVKQLGSVDAGVIAQLLFIAVQLGPKYTVVVDTFCSVAAAACIGVTEVCQLLATALANADVQAAAHNISSLGRLSAAQQLSVQQVHQLIHQLLQRSALCHLPAAAQPSAAHVAELLALAVSGSAASCAIALCELPAAQQLMGQHVLGVLQEAIQNRSAATVVALWQIPAARSSNHEAVVDSLQAAGDSTAGEPSATFIPTDVVSTLLAGFPAGQLPAAAVAWGLVEAAAKLGYNAAKRLPDVMAALCNAQQLDSVDADVIAQLLFIAVQLGSRYTVAVDTFCLVPAADGIGVTKVCHLLATALANADVQVAVRNVNSLGRLSAAQQLSVQQVHQLFQQALQRSAVAANSDRDTCLLPIKELCSLRAAAELSSEQVMNLVEAGVQCSRPGTDSRHAVCQLIMQCASLYG